MAAKGKKDDTPKVSGSAATAANRERRMAKQKKLMADKAKNPPKVPHGTARALKRGNRCAVLNTL